MHTGIDMGLGVTAITTLDDKGMVCYKTQFGSLIQEKLKKAIKIHPCDRYALYHDTLRAYFNKHKITGTIVMEEPAGSMVGHRRKLVELKGVYLIALHHLEIPTTKIFLPSPTAIKKTFTKKGDATKSEMIKECQNRGILPLNDHEADSVAMAFMSIEGVL